MPVELTYRKTAAFTKPPATLDEKARSVEVVGATEQPVEVFDPERWAVVSEVLLMTGCEMPFSRQIPLIDSHQRERGAASVLGSCRDIHIAGDQLLGRVYFSNAAEAESPWMKVREGHLTDFSVGYRVIESTWIPEGESALVKGRSFKGPLRVTSRWRPKELSVVPIAADDQAKARSATSQAPLNQHAEERINTMPDTTTQDPTEIAIRAERERVAEISACCRHFNIPEETSGRFIREGVTVGAARKQVLDILAQRSPQIPAPIVIIADEGEKRAAAVVDGLVLRTGLTLERQAPGANEYRETPLYAIAGECLLAAGIRTGGLSRNQIVSKALQQRGHVAADFPALLANTANKVLRRAYELAPASWQKWCQIGNAADFKEMSRTQLSEAPDLDEVPEHGLYKYGAFGDSKEVFQIAKHGKLFAITREALVNDDLAAFTRIPLAFGASAKRKINSAVYGVLTANAAMSDGVALFHASHGNLGSGTALGKDGLSAGRLAMRTQTGLSGAVLNIAPAYLLVPAALETTADGIWPLRPRSATPSRWPSWAGSNRLTWKPATAGRSTAWSTSAASSSASRRSTGAGFSRTPARADELGGFKAAAGRPLR